MPRNIDALIWRALTDVHFRKGLLNGSRLELVDAMELTAKEKEAVLAVEADSLEALAGALCQCCHEPRFARGWNLA